MYSYAALKILEVDRELPTKLRVDIEPEFISSTLAEDCKTGGMNLLHIKPVKPTQNDYIDRFNRLFREDVLDTNLFSGFDQLQVGFANVPPKYKVTRTPCETNIS